MTNFTKPGLTSQEYVLWQVLYYGLAGTAFVLNLLIVILTLSFERLRIRPFNWFFMSVSFAYMLQCGFFIPFKFKPLLLGRFEPMTATWLCSAAPWVLDIAFMVEAVSVIAIASYIIHHVRKRYFPVDPYIPKSMVFLLIVAIWVFAIAISFPWAYFRHVTKNDVTGAWKCSKTKENWYNYYENYVAYLGSAVAAVLGIVLVVTAAMKLRRKDVTVTWACKKEFQITACFLIKLCLCWLPTGLMIIIYNADNNLMNFPSHPYLRGVINRFVYCTAALWNPIIIFAISPLYRRSLCSMLCCQKAPPGSDKVEPVKYSNSAPNKLTNHSKAGPTEQESAAYQQYQMNQYLASQQQYMAGMGQSPSDAYIYGTAQQTYGYGYDSPSSAWMYPAYMNGAYYYPGAGLKSGQEQTSFVANTNAGKDTPYSVYEPTPIYSNGFYGYYN